MGWIQLPQDEDAHAHSLYFSHFGDGAVGDLQLFIQIILINPNPSAPALAQLTLREDSGGDLFVDLNGQEIAGRFDIEIPAGGMRILKTDGEREVRAGSVLVSSDVPLAGVILFGGSVGAAGVGTGQILEDGFLASIQTQHSSGINTGIALMNLEGQDNSVHTL